MPEVDHRNGTAKHGDHHQPSAYDFSFFGPASKFAPVLPTSINSQGDVVGFGLAPIIGPVPFVYENGTFAVPPDLPNSQLFEINDKGQAVGTRTITDKFSHTVSVTGFLYEDGTSTPVTITGASAVSAVDINNGGVSVGSYRDSAGMHGFSYRDGSFSTIDAPGAVSTVAWVINDKGAVAGTYNDADGVHGYINRKDAFATFDLPGASNIRPYEINNKGQVVGTFSDGITQHGFIYGHGDARTIDVPGASATEVRDINDRGEIVGFFQDTAGTHGFVYGQQDFRVVDVPGATITQLFSINDQGEVAGQYSNQQTAQAFTATPVNSGAWCGAHAADTLRLPAPSVTAISN